MSTSTIELTAPLQSLIDERLDTIERVLLIAGVSRGERRAVVGEVESHVFELLGRRAAGEPTRDDVLAVLSQLDPPESYAPEGFDRRAIESAWSAPPPREPQLSAVAVTSAAVGALIVPALIASALVFELETVSFVLAGGLLAVSIVGYWTLVRIHRSHGLLYGAQPALFATLLFPLLALNGVAAVGISALDELAVFGGIAIAFLAFNGGIIYAAWRLCASACPPPTSPPRFR